MRLRRPLPAVQGDTLHIVGVGDNRIGKVRSTVLENKQLKHSDVLILYFERNKSNVRIHEISMDEDANLLNVPDGYRNFFIDEERKLLGI